MRTGAAVAVWAVLSIIPAGLFGQGSYSFIVSDSVAPEELLYQQDISLSVMNDTTVSGWSVSMCHDASASDICGGNLTPFVTGLNQIGPLFFASLAIYGDANPVPGSDPGLACGLVIDQSGFFFFPNNTTEVIVNAHFIARPGTAGSSATTTICSTVGNPLVETVVVCCGGTSIPIGPDLTGVSGGVDFVASSDQWTFSGDSHAVQYDLVTGLCMSLCSPTIPLRIANTAANATLTEGAGFSFALTYDPTYVSVNAISPSAALLALNGGSGPDVFATNDTGTGISVQCLNTMLPMIPVLPYVPDLSTWTGEAAVDLEVTIDASSLIGLPVTTTITSLSWGDPGDGSSNSVTVICGSRNLVDLKAIECHDIEIVLLSNLGLDFLRGDCNSDTIVNIADAIWTISGYLTSPPAGPEGLCEAACDVNDDGNVDVADVAYTFMYRFAGGPAPLPPFPQCGNQSGADCLAFNGCP